ncbi:6780_t:CDS:10, partial [Diversispora eburnea]
DNDKGSIANENRSIFSAHAVTPYPLSQEKSEINADSLDFSDVENSYSQELSSAENVNNGINLGEIKNKDVQIVFGEITGNAFKQDDKKTIKFIAMQLVLSDLQKLFPKNEPVVEELETFELLVYMFSQDIVNLLLNSEDYNVIIHVGKEEREDPVLFNNNSNKGEEEDNLEVNNRYISSDIRNDRNDRNDMDDYHRTQTFKAHSLILGARSNYFQTALSKQWAKKEGEANVLSQPNISPKVFEIILNGTISLSDRDILEILDILSAADELLLTDLLDYIQEYLIEIKSRWLHSYIIPIYQVCLAHDSYQKITPIISTITPTSPFEDYNNLTNTLQDCIPLIRFFQMSSIDLYDKVWRPFREILPSKLEDDIVKCHLKPGTKPEFGINTPRGNSTLIGHQQMARETCSYLASAILALTGIYGETLPLKKMDCKCGKPAKHLQTKKENANKGRWFFTCFSKNCNFFKWDDDTPRSSQDSTMNSGPSSMITNDGSQPTSVQINFELYSKREFIVQGYHPKLVDLWKNYFRGSYKPDGRGWVLPLSKYEEAIKKLREENFNFNVEINVSSELWSTLMTFQKEGVTQTIMKEGRILLGDEMGLGKTIQALTICQFYQSDCPVLIICPSSLRLTWSGEIRKWLQISDDEIQVFFHTKDKVRSPIPKFVITSYDLIAKMSEEYEDKFNIIVCDEAHYLRNRTGTPALSKPSELFSLANALDKSTFASFPQYGARYCAAVRGAFGWDYSGSSNLSELNWLLERTILIRRLKKDVELQLPPKTRQIIYVDIPASALREIQALQKESKKYHSIARTATGSQRRDAELKGKALIVQMWSETGRSKVPAVQEYLYEIYNNSEKKFLIFAHHIEVLDSITEFIESKLKAKYIRIDGSTNQSRRQALVDEFQDDKRIRIAILSLTAASAGLTLHSADLVIFAELFWNPSTLLQAEDRAHRIGRQGCVDIKYILVKDTSDSIQWEMVRQKLKVVGKMLDNNIEKVTMEEGTSFGAIDPDLLSWFGKEKLNNDQNSSHSSMNDLVNDESKEDLIDLVDLVKDESKEDLIDLVDLVKDESKEEDLIDLFDLVNYDDDLINYDVNVNVKDETKDNDLVKSDETKDDDLIKGDGKDDLLMHDLEKDDIFPLMDFDDFDEWVKSDDTLFPKIETTCHEGEIIDSNINLDNDSENLTLYDNHNNLIDNENETKSKCHWNSDSFVCYLKFINNYIWPPQNIMESQEFKFLIIKHYVNSMDIKDCKLDDELDDKSFNPEIICQQLGFNSFEELSSHFRDDKFPPEDSSICKRVGNSWFVSALGVLSAHPHLLEKVIPKWSLQDWNHSEEPGKQLGMYNFRDTEQWIEVIIDDYLPTRNGQLIYAHSKDPREMWCSLLEKAYAKLCGGYRILETGAASDAIVDLTGTVPETIELNKEGILGQLGEKGLINLMKMENSKHSLMSCSINAFEEERKYELLPNGLVVELPYGITDIQVVKIGVLKINNEIVLIKLHNPCNEVEWSGPWSNKSPEWNLVDNIKRNKLIVQDGDFWMSFHDFITNFNSLVICRHLNTSLFSRGKRWHGTTFYGEWSIENETAGGCINNNSTFYQNPQYLIRINKPTTDLVISLMQSDHRSEIGVEYITIGFICLKVEENRKYRIHKSTYEVVGRVTYINSREVTKRITLNEGQYILIPSTYNIGDEGEFFLRIFSSKEININLLKKDAPKKNWYYPILYQRRAYYVGMVRAKIICGQFNREITKGFVRIIFLDLRSRIKKAVISPIFNNSFEPDIEAEYLFYVRNPSLATIIFQLYECSTFGKDNIIGEVKILLGHYAKSSKEGRFWEITKTMTRVIKAPPSGEDNNDEAHILRSFPKQKLVVTPMEKGRTDKGFLIPITVDAGIGELKIRMIYLRGNIFQLFQNTTSI